MKKIAILGAGTVGGSCAQILLRDAAVLEKNAGEALELAYVVDLRDMPDAPFHDKMVKDFAVVEADPEVFLVIEAIGDLTDTSVVSEQPPLAGGRQARRHLQQAARRRARHAAAGAGQGPRRELPV